MNELFLFGPGPDGPPDNKKDGTPEPASNGGHVSNFKRKHNRIPVSGPWVRRDAPDTSKEAASRVAPLYPDRMATVLAAIAATGAVGMTDHEIAAATGIVLQSVTGLRGGLASNGLIKLSGAKRPTPSGFSARVWVLAEHGPTAEGGVQ
jgi:hypothetical protein